MRCEDVEKILSNDNGDLKAVAKHLECCTACMAKYRDDLELEVSLRGLTSEPLTMDVTADLRRSLYPKYKAIRRLSLAQRWVWRVSGALAAASIILGMPTFLNWLEQVSISAQNGLKNLPLMEGIGINDLYQVADYLKSSGYLEYIIIALGLALATIFSYLFREFKEIVQ
jgi:hypothetical protein